MLYSWCVLRYSAQVYTPHTVNTETSKGSFIALQILSTSFMFAMLVAGWVKVLKSARSAYVSTSVAMYASDAPGRSISCDAKPTTRFQLLFLKSPRRRHLRTAAWGMMTQMMLIIGSRSSRRWRTSWPKRSLATRTVTAFATSSTDAAKSRRLLSLSDLVFIIH